MADMVYLDWNATAPLRPEARAALIGALDHIGNPSSVHGFGRRARRLVEDAREQVAALAGASPAQVTFTGGGTEANNQALALAGDKRRLLVGATEHASVLEVRADAVAVPVDGDGLIDSAALAALLAADSQPALVSIQAVNNETGVIQDMASLAAIVHAHGGWLHSDAVQAAGRIPIDMAAWGCDLLSLSAHKIGGPHGVGALLAVAGIPLAPLLRGGGQERRMRAGTENVAGIAGFGAACAASLAGLADYAALSLLRDRLETAVLALAPTAQIIGAGAPRVANTSCIALPGVPANSQLMAFDLAGIAVSAGSACSSGKVKSSHVLRAMGLEEALAGAAIRVSLGWDSTEADIDRFIACWDRIAARTRPAA
ncbi:cysteine desulfurase family protein [Niveispirillum irakense]|uniref:cysteine desulfurase family protein n=1 Tax=Niveispirillum irakense TaxID=34011 RepID=UPI0003F68FF6|nr:cysteine desulfurase family protein [Niveispirillum irakense]